MRKTSLLLCVLFLMPAFAFAQNSRGWQVELDRLAFNFSSTEVSYAKEYAGFQTRG